MIVVPPATAGCWNSCISTGKLDSTGPSISLPWNWFPGSNQMLALAFKTMNGSEFGHPKDHLHSQEPAHTLWSSEPLICASPPRKLLLVGTINKSLI